VNLRLALKDETGQKQLNKRIILTKTEEKAKEAKHSSYFSETVQGGKECSKDLKPS